MPHVRKQLRDAIRARITGLSTTGSKVYDAPSDPIPPTELPALALYLLSETAETTTKNRQQERVLEIRIEALAAYRSPLAGEVNATADELDQMAAEIEAALAGDLTFGSLVRDVQFQGTEIDFTPDGQSQTAMARLRFSLTYDTREGQPETVLAAEE